MRIVRVLSLGAALVCCGFSYMAMADCNAANCEVTRDGEFKKKESGLCTLVESGGSVTIELRTGKAIKLVPGNKKEHFKDKKGQMVVRSGVNKGKGQKYKWDHKKIVVTYAP
jgi:hypothetical protein